MRNGRRRWHNGLISGTTDLKTDFEDYKVEYSKMGFTEDERSTNYDRLVHHLNILESGRITEDIMEDMKKYCSRLRDHYPDFSIMNLEIEDMLFRTCAHYSEILFQEIKERYRTDQVFDLNLYKMLLQNIKCMVEHVSEEESLSDMMSSVGF